MGFFISFILSTFFRRRLSTERGRWTRGLHGSPTSRQWDSSWGSASLTSMDGRRINRLERWTMMIQNVNICQLKISGQTYSQAKYVFENVLELEEHTPTGPIILNICKPELTKVIPVAQCSLKLQDFLPGYSCKSFQCWSLCWHVPSFGRSCHWGGRSLFLPQVHIFNILPDDARVSFEPPDEYS